MWNFHCHGILPSHHHLLHHLTPSEGFSAWLLGLALLKVSISAPRVRSVCAVTDGQRDTSQPKLTSAGTSGNFFVVLHRKNSLIQPLLKIYMPIKHSRKRKGEKKSLEKSPKPAALPQPQGRGPLIWANHSPACLSRGQHDGFRNTKPRITTVGNVSLNY